MLRKTYTQFLVLDYLNDFPHSHGYILTQELDLSNATVYNMLRRLKARDFLNLKKTYPPNAPPRITYTLTHRGKKWLEELKTVFDH